MTDLPNNDFSFSWLTAKFSDYQERGLMAVQVEKILLETDSPHLVVRGVDTRDEVSQNLPLYLGKWPKWWRSSGGRGLVMS